MTFAGTTRPISPITQTSAMNLFADMRINGASCPRIYPPKQMSLLIPNTASNKFNAYLTSHRRGNWVRFWFWFSASGRTRCADNHRIAILGKFGWHDYSSCKCQQEPSKLQHHPYQFRYVHTGLVIWSDQYMLKPHQQLSSNQLSSLSPPL